MRNDAGPEVRRAQTGHAPNVLRFAIIAAVIAVAAIAFAAASVALTHF